MLRYGRCANVGDCRDGHYGGGTGARLYALDRLGGLVMLTFSVARFKQCAPVDIRRRLSAHLDVLDNQPVIMSADGKHGYIKGYECDGDYYYLYPVERCWCEVMDDDD